MRARANAERDHWRRALARYADLGLPEADDVRTELAALGSAASRASAAPRPGPRQRRVPGLGRVSLAIPADVRVRTGWPRAGSQPGDGRYHLAADYLKRSYLPDPRHRAYRSLESHLS